jgi:L-threonylcarbamoyladenylate synthase
MTVAACPGFAMPNARAITLCHADRARYHATMTKTLADDPADIARAAALLRAGALVAFGTETVYGLGADATDARAVAAVFAAKGRPHFNPLICHYPDAGSAFAHVAANTTAQRLADALWPGPLSLVLPRRADCAVALLAGAGRDTLAVRVPAHATALALLRSVGRPVAAPSANRSGQISPTTARHVLNGLAGRIAAVLDSGPCPVGVESTVLDLCGTRPFLLRPGGVTVEAIEALVGPVGRGFPLAMAEAAPTMRSPGLQVSHYAPDAPVRLGADIVFGDEALLAFGPKLPGAAAGFQLSASCDVTEAAANLFTGLRALDAEVARLGLTGIAVMPVPEHGLGLAINDRLRRAAAPRGRLGYPG